MPLVLRDRRGKYNPSFALDCAHLFELRIDLAKRLYEVLLNDLGRTYECKKNSSAKPFIATLRKNSPTFMTRSQLAVAPRQRYSGELEPCSA